MSERDEKTLLAEVASRLWDVIELILEEEQKIKPPAQRADGKSLATEPARKYVFAKRPNATLRPGGKCKKRKHELRAEDIGTNSVGKHFCKKCRRIAYARKRRAKKGDMF